MAISQLLFLTIFAVIITLPRSLQDTYSLILYEQGDFASWSMRFTENEPNLSRVGFNDRAHSACWTGL